MKKFFGILFFVIALTACKKDKEEDTQTTEQDIEATKTAPAALSFATQHYAKEAKVCKDSCSYVNITVPQAVNGNKVVADSINKKVFNTVREIVYFGEKPTNSTNYTELTNSFIKSYEDLVKKFPEEGEARWEAKIDGSITYQSDNIINIRLNNYMFTGGAHGYDGSRSIIFDKKTGKYVNPKQLFTDIKSFTALAEQKFRDKYKIPRGKSINATGKMFDKQKFALPQNIFFTDKGLLLHYNPYEAASYADGPQEVLIPYSIAGDYLKMK